MDLTKTDLVIDKVYGGSRNGNASDDPLPKLLGVDNGAGFRHLGKRPETSTLKMLALKSNFNDHDWPDHLDKEAGVLTYYGDNKKAADIHDTPRKGNLILHNLFRDAADLDFTHHFPPIFVFGGTGEYRDMRFLGLAVPGLGVNSLDDDLVAVWRTKKGGIRYQNYRARFSILDVPVVPRRWIYDIQRGNACTSDYAPSKWIDWVKLRKYDVLGSPRAVDIRSKDEQLPSTKEDLRILETVVTYFSKNPFAFEKCAAELTKLLLPEISNIELTQKTRDGGRDALGKYRIGSDLIGIQVDFSLEAKCYSLRNSVGIKELSRLISRIRNRQFGVLITTSYLGKQAYEELKEDRHPIVVISGLDIVSVLKQRVGTLSNIRQWLCQF